MSVASTGRKGQQHKPQKGLKTKRKLITALESYKDKI
jgi:hypothetical protein